MCQTELAKFGSIKMILKFYRQVIINLKQEETQRK